jgi:hypothetical protein
VSIERYRIIVQPSQYHSILEYMSREEAERAVKDLDGKELRGRSVRVTLDESVSFIYT